jgi:hypothetical protein
LQHSLPLRARSRASALLRLRPESKTNGRPPDCDPASARRAWGLSAIPLLPGGRWGRPRSRFCQEGVGSDRNSASARRA